MYKKILVAILGILALGPIGCADEEIADVENEIFEVVKVEEIDTLYNSTELVVIRDKETGHEYILADGEGITPRLKEVNKNE